MHSWQIVTGEYPPDEGGVAAYTATVAHALAEMGDQVHVWTSGRGGTALEEVTVHRALGKFRRRDLAAWGERLDRLRGDARLLIQWVPHAFGRRGVNLDFPVWLYNRTARRSQPVDVMVHEPFVPFGGTLARCGAAAAQRLMTSMVVRSASRVFVATPEWAAMCRPYAPRISFRWAPVPSGIPRLASDRRGARRRLGLPETGSVIGCFGRAGDLQQRSIASLGDAVVGGSAESMILLIGAGSEALRARLLRRTPRLAPMLVATGSMTTAAVSAALGACDVMLQPYPDGICTRHSSAAALLAHALPIVTNAGRFTEPLWTGTAVRLLPSPGAGDLADAALRLLADSDERARLGRAALELYDSHFHVRHTVSALRS